MSVDSVLTQMRKDQYPRTSVSDQRLTELLTKFAEPNVVWRSKLWDMYTVLWHFVHWEGKRRKLWV
jgi:hypothetical protein